MSESYNLFCGAVAGAASRTFTAPLELKSYNCKIHFIPNTTIKALFKKKVYFIYGKVILLIV